MKILVMGDVHAEWGLLNTVINKKNPDIILQCGDFGYFPHIDDIALKEDDIKNPNTKIYWCPGNHENWDELDRFGYNITEIKENIFYCPFGTVLELPDKRKVLFVGGAESIDKMYRTEGYSWWKNEIITNDDMDYFYDNIKNPQEIDIVISHTCPTKFTLVGSGGLGRMSAKSVDPSKKALDIVLEECKPSLWFFGHYHDFQTGRYHNTKWIMLNRDGKTNWYVDLGDFCK